MLELRIVVRSLGSRDNPAVTPRTASIPAGEERPQTLNAILALRGVGGIDVRDLVYGSTVATLTVFCTYQRFDDVVVTCNNALAAVGVLAVAG
jgi:hypothetical protein